MKNLILSFIVVSGLISTINAQESQTGGQPKNLPQERKNPSPDERARHEANKAERQLGLDAEQKVKWEAAARERASVNLPLKEKLAGATTPEERKKLHQQLKASNDKFEDSVNGFLNAEQKTKFAQVKKERREARKNRKKGQAGEMSPDNGLGD